MSIVKNWTLLCRTCNQYFETTCPQKCDAQGNELPESNMETMARIKKNSNIEFENLKGFIRKHEGHVWVAGAFEKTRRDPIILDNVEMQFSGMKKI